MATLPQDIIVETLISVLVVSIGLVLGADKLKPISWRDWAGEIERDGGARNPYVGLEERYNFWDIRVSQLSRDIGSDATATATICWYTVYVERRANLSVILGQAKGICGLGSRTRHDQGVIALRIPKRLAS